MEPRREISINEARLFIVAEGGFESRLRTVVYRTGIDMSLVRAVVMEFLRPAHNRSGLRATPYWEPAVLTALVEAATDQPNPTTELRRALTAIEAARRR